MNRLIFVECLFLDVKNILPRSELLMVIWTLSVDFS